MKYILEVECIPSEDDTIEDYLVCLAALIANRYSCLNCNTRLLAECEIKEES